MGLYPRDPCKEPGSLNLIDAQIIARILVLMDAGATKEEAAGLVPIDGASHARYLRLWKEVEDQRDAVRRLNPGDYDTLTKFKASIERVAPDLNATTWYNRLIAVQGVSSWAALKGASSKQDDLQTRGN